MVAIGKMESAKIRIKRLLKTSQRLQSHLQFIKKRAGSPHELLVTIISEALEKSEIIYQSMTDNEFIDTILTIKDDSLQDFEIEAMTRAIFDVRETKKTNPSLLTDEQIEHCNLIEIALVKRISQMKSAGETIPYPRPGLEEYIEEISQEIMVGILS